MRYLVIFLFGCLLLSAFSPAYKTYKWGFFGHRKITEMAIYTLPPELIGFYKTHLNVVVENSVLPDKRRYVIAEEGPRHYIDLDLYENADSLPKYWPEAVKVFGEDSLIARGVVPWYAQFTYRRLVTAMAEHNISRVVSLSADLAHYIADAHVPLHTTSNYNGQFTNQKGIHAFWESRLPELYFEEYDFFVGRAAYLNDTQAAIWDAVFHANTLVDSLLALDIYLTQQIGDDKKYSYEQRGRSTVRVASKIFSRRYHESFPMIEEQMRASVKMIGDFWLTAWVEAGQPDLVDNAGMEVETLENLAGKEKVVPERAHQH
jgi:hypothetical protein